MFEAMVVTAIRLQAARCHNHHPGIGRAAVSRGYRRLALLRLRLAFQIAAAVPRTASAATLHRIRSAGPVTETAPIA
jgi:hypothetical protein